MRKWYLISVVFLVLALVSFGLDFYTHWSDWYFYFLYNGITDIGLYFIGIIATFAVLAMVAFLKGYFDHKEK